MEGKFAPDSQWLWRLFISLALHDEREEYLTWNRSAPKLPHQAQPTKNLQPRRNDDVYVTMTNLISERPENHQLASS